MKQVTLATAASLALCFTACAAESATTAPAAQGQCPTAHHHSHTHHGYDSNWAHGWYIGAGVNGDANMTDKTPFGQDNWADTQESNVDFEKSDNDAGFDVYVGRKVSKHFAFEMGYTMLGDQNFESETSKDLEETAEVEQWNVHAVAIAKWPIGDYFDVFAKGGVAYYHNQTDFDGEAVEDPNSTLDTFALTYGAGIEVNWDQFGVRGEYNVIAPNHADKDNFYISDVVGASIFYRFM